MITLLVIVTCLFVLGLLFAKRFGVLTLGLAAGLTISGYMSATVTPIVAPYINQYSAYVPAFLVVFPAVILLLFMKGRHRKIIARVVHAAIFAVAGLVFVLAAPGTPRALQASVPVIADNLGLIITGLLALATLEVAFGKVSKKKKIEDVPKK